MSDIENLTIMLTDIVGFSKMVSSLSRVESETLVKSHDKILKRVIKRFGGNVIKTAGDSFLVIFRSPTDAVLCAMAIHDSLWAVNNDMPENQRIVVRIALNTGEVRLSNKDVFGEAVNIAARLESETPAGAIHLTETVYLSMNRNEVKLEALGYQTFKGIPQAIRIFKASRNHQDIKVDDQSFPYGGAHIALAPAGKNFFTVSKLFIILPTAIIAAFASWLTTLHYMPAIDRTPLDKVEINYQSSRTVDENDTVAFLPDINTEIRNKAEPLIANNNFIGIQKLINEYNQEQADNAYLTMLSGHIAMNEKQYEEAINFYESALKIDAALADNSVLATNLVTLIDHQRLKANRLIGLFFSELMVGALARRTGKKGLRGRYDAFYLLKNSGNIDKVDKVGLNIWDLRELKKCSLKKVAIEELKRLNDPRALPALKEMQTLNILKLIRYHCLSDALGAAIEQLENA
ncbi:MAG: adenylate/guanylate cyclase domain-containing protein [Pseudomonadota bacterium]